MAKNKHDRKHTPESADDNLKGSFHESRQPKSRGEVLVRGVALEVWSAHGNALCSCPHIIESVKKTTTKIESKCSSTKTIHKRRGKRKTERKQGGRGVMAIYSLVELKRSASHKKS